MNFYLGGKGNRLASQTFLAWFLIIIQTLFPLVWSFTPAVVFAKNEGSLSKQINSPDSAKTRNYILAPGETTVSVAKKFHISLEQLRRLNEFRTFARGFDHLQAGDELDVPVTSVAQYTKEDANEGGKTTDVWASYAKQTGSFLSNHPNGEAASALLRNSATNEAASSVQGWLSQFGTARVNLETNNKFSLENSGVDLLVPLYERGDSLFFTQDSLHHSAQRTQTNLGLGYRWFSGDYMLGMNTFLDYDLTGKHARSGLGIEYWRNYLKLGMNGYRRITDWKKSQQLSDYEARPANGWDLRAEAYLPAYPQLGTNLSYEQYYGNEVGLFNENKRQHNPHAVTAGINYTPVPLVTLSAEESKGQSGLNDTKLGLELNYKFGVPWHKQISPDAVSALRTLAGSRYDLVDRNNNIVLEYRKKNVISLHTVSLITGYAGELKPLNVTVNSKYGLKEIKWSASSLFEAGGKIISNGALSYEIKLPEYHSGTQGTNTYIVSGVAYDKKGNVSKDSMTQVTVKELAVDIRNSSLTPSNITIPADGKTQTTLKLVLRDKEGIPINVRDDEIHYTKTELKKSTEIKSKNNTSAITPFQRKGNGEYIATITAGNSPETFLITPSVYDTELTLSLIHI